MEDLRVGMELEGVVTNVTAFGAFVDVGVHQDGLVHVSKLADRFIRDPSEVVKVGDRIKVRVVEVDLQRKRISLTARRDEKIENRGAQPAPAGRPQQPRRPGGPPPQQFNSDAKGFSNNPFAKLRKN